MNFSFNTSGKILLYFILILLISCADDENTISKEVTVETISSKNRSGGGVILSGSLANVPENVDFKFILSTIEDGTYDRRGKVKIVDKATEGIHKTEFTTDLKVGQKYYYNVFIFLNDKYYFGKEKVFVSNGSAIPVINNVSLNKVSLLDTILIKGSYFSQVPKVYFSGIESVPLSASDSLIKVIVPYPRNNYLSTAPYSNIKIVNRDEQETTLDFSLHTPRIDSIRPKKIIDSDTLRIYGDYFETDLKNMVFTNADNKEIIYDILESTKNTIVLKPIDIRLKKSEIIVRSQLSSAKTEVELIMPEIISIPNKCYSFEEDFVIKVANFPINSERLVVKFGDNYHPPSIKTKDSLIYRLYENTVFKDFKNNEISINYLDEVIVAEDKVCVNEPWINLNYNPKFNYVLKMHVYNNNIYALGNTPTNFSSVKNVFKFNSNTVSFDKITNSSFDEAYLTDTGSLSTFYEDKLYVKNYASNFFSYNINTNQKVELADFPGEIREYGFMITLEDYIYAGLGLKYPGQPLADIWRYSIQENTWKKIIDSFPEITSYQTSKISPIVFSMDNKILIGSGQPNIKKLDFWELDTQNNQVMRKSDLPKIFEEVNTNYQQIVKIEDKIYFQFKSMLEYNSTTDEWKSYQTNDKRYHLAGYFYFNDAIHMSFDTHIYKFNPDILK